jgi:hypothetical protein
LRKIKVVICRESSETIFNVIFEFVDFRDDLGSYQEQYQSICHFFSYGKFHDKAWCSPVNYEAHS